MHLVANQMGDLTIAERLIAAQAAIGKSVTADPSLFHLVLDEQLLRVLTEELQLEPSRRNSLHEPQRIPSSLSLTGSAIR